MFAKRAAVLSRDGLLEQKRESWHFFESLSRRYDWINHVLSLGLDNIWRQILARHIKAGPHETLLDVATGTGDVLVTVCREMPDLKFLCGLDRSPAMLSVATQKIQHLGLSRKFEFLCGDAQCLALPDNSFSVVTIAFGIRNMPQPELVLAEIRRVLNTNGRIFILEFSLPDNLLIRSLYLFYLRFFVPFIGGLLSGVPAAYHYLYETIRQFPGGTNFGNILHQQGFRRVQITPLCLGIATIYQAEK